MEIIFLQFEAKVNEFKVDVGIQEIAVIEACDHFVHTIFTQELTHGESTVVYPYTKRGERRKDRGVYLAAGHHPGVEFNYLRERTEAICSMLNLGE